MIGRGIEIYTPLFDYEPFKNNKFFSRKNHIANFHFSHCNILKNCMRMAPKQREVHTITSTQFHMNAVVVAVVAVVVVVVVVLLWCLEPNIFKKYSVRVHGKMLVPPNAP